MVFFARGILAKASYELFWEEKSHAPNGKTQACTQDALLFFLLTLERRVGGWVGGWVGGCSHYVPFKFQWVPITFSKCSSSSQCVPQHVLCSTSLSSHMLWQLVSSFFTYIRGLKGMNSILQSRTFYFGEPP